MAVDITLLFRASVKTVKTRNKALGVAVGGGVEGSRDELFRRSPRPKDDFSSRAREVVSWLLWKRRAGELRARIPNPTVSGRAVCQRAWGRWYEEGGGRVSSGELTAVGKRTVLGFPWCSDGKASARNAGGPRFDPRVGKIPWRKENGNPLQYCCLENSTDGGASLVGYSPWARRVNFTSLWVEEWGRMLGTRNSVKFMGFFLR